MGGCSSILRRGGTVGVDGVSEPVQAPGSRGSHLGSSEGVENHEIRSKMGSMDSKQSNARSSIGEDVDMSKLTAKQRERVMSLKYRSEASPESETSRDPLRPQVKRRESQKFLKSTPRRASTLGSETPRSVAESPKHNIRSLIGRHTPKITSPISSFDVEKPEPLANLAIESTLVRVDSLRRLAAGRPLLPSSDLRISTTDSEMCDLQAVLNTPKNLDKLRSNQENTHVNTLGLDGNAGRRYMLNRFSSGVATAAMPASPARGQQESRASVVSSETKSKNSSMDSTYFRSRGSREDDYDMYSEKSEKSVSSVRTHNTHAETHTSTHVSTHVSSQESGTKEGTAEGTHSAPSNESEVIVASRDNDEASSEMGADSVDQYAASPQSLRNAEQLDRHVRSLREPDDVGDEQELDGLEETHNQVVIDRGRRMSVSASSHAESYVDDAEMADNPEGSLAHVVFGPLPRMARMSEQELGECLMMMDQAQATRQPLSQMLRGELLSGMAISSDASSGWIAKLNMGKVVRFFFSSTFADTELERNLFLEDCVPFLRRVTALQGVEFQVSEMRWGINNMMSERHQTSRECMKELRRCQESSMGLSFVGMLGDRYGYRPFPAVIDSDLFSKIREKMVTQGKEGVELIDKWFTMDMNVIPPVHRLAPIHVYLPDYIDMTKEGVDARRAAENEWWVKNFEPMQDYMRRAAIALLEAGETTAEVADLFVRSVTEEEMVLGICTEEGGGILSVRQDKRSALIIRNLVGIHQVGWEDPAKCKYTDKEKGDDAADMEAAELIKTLRNRLVNKISQDRLFEFDVEWEPGGIDPVKHEMHREYLAGLTDTLVHLNIEEIVEQLKERPLLTGLESEIMHHLDLCLDKSRKFAGRGKIIDEVMNFLKDDSGEGPSTLVIVGDSGVGKSFVMAEAFKRLTQYLEQQRLAKAGRLKKSHKIMSATSLEWKEFSDEGHAMEMDGPCAMIRFIGSHLNSRSAREIMQSCCAQTTSFFSSLPEDVPADYLSLKDALPHSLSRATAERPIYLFLDALDQMTNGSVGQPLAWLPVGASLPPHVKLIISTVDTGSNGKPSLLLNTIMARTDESNATMVKIEGFEEGEREEMLKTWLAQTNRQLTEAQSGAIISASMNDKTALLLSMLHERSKEWTSTTDLTDIGRIPDTAAEAINQMFDELEKVHTKELVSLVLGAITAAKDGMSAAELEDLASSTDEVLLALFVWWAPPMARVPPLQVVRLLHDISEYVTESVGSGNQMVYQWTHRKFKEQGSKRYLTVKLHEALADLFSGAKSRKDLPLKITLSSGEVRELPGNRRLPAQEPVLVRLAGDPMHYNERMLSELPHHLLMSSRYNDLLNLVLDPEVFEFYAQTRNQPVLAQIWRELIVSSIRASPLSEYTAMLDNLQPDIKQRKEAALARKVGEFLSTLMARMSDAKAFMQRSVQVSEDMGLRLETARGLDGVAKVEMAQGNYEAAIRSLNKSLMIKVEELGGKNLEVATTMHTTADVLQKQSKLKEALRVFKESCEIRRELQGADSMDVAISLDRMGVVYKKLGNYQQSLQNFLQSKEIFELRFGKENLTVAGALMNLGNVLKYLGRYEEAVEKHQESVAIKKRILGPMHPEVAKSLGNLGSVFEKIGQPENALAIYAECLVVQKEKLGPKSQDVARTLKGRGVILNAQGRLDEALLELDEALGITEKIVGHMHRDVAALLLVIAECLFNKCMYSEALVKYHDAIQITRIIVGADKPHMDIAVAMRGKGNVMLATGEDEAALALFKESHGIFVACVGNKHSEVAMSLDMIASALTRLGRYEEALKQHLLARDARQKTEADSRAVATNYVYIADIYTKTGELRNALEFYKMAHKIQAKMSKEGAGTPQIAHTLSSMGVVYKKLGQYQLAAVEYGRASKILRSLYGPTHLSIAVVTMNQANVYHHMGAYEMALAAHKEALDIKIHLLGSKNREVAKSLGNTALTLMKLGRYDEAQEMYERCLEIQLRIQNGRTLDVARTLRGKGGVLSNQGKLDEALESYESSREITVEVVGEKHLDIAEINYSIGHVLQQKKKHDEANTRFLAAIAITEDLVGEYHHICSSAQRGLGEIHFEKEEYEQALECFQKSSTIMDALLSGTVEESTMSPVAASENDNSDRSLKLRLDALEAGPRDNLDSAITKYNIHMALMKIGRPDQHEEADKNLEEALQVFTNVLGVEHSWTQTASRGTGEPLPSSITAAETTGTGTGTGS